jgi:hypothetical protein
VAEIIDEHKLLQVVDFPTTPSNCLDLIFTSSATSILDCYIDMGLYSAYSVDGKPCSDHYPVRLRLDASTTVERHPPRPFLSYGMADFDDINSHILAHPFTGTCWSNPNVLVSEWYAWLNDLLYRLIPRKTQHRLLLPP